MTRPPYIKDGLVGVFFSLIPGIVAVYEIISAAVQHSNKMIGNKRGTLENLGIFVPHLSEQPIQLFSIFLLAITVFTAIILFVWRTWLGKNNWKNGLVAYWSVHWTSFIITVIAGTAGVTGLVDATLQASIGIGVGLLLQTIGTIFNWRFNLLDRIIC